MNFKKAVFFHTHPPPFFAPHQNINYHKTNAIEFARNQEKVPKPPLNPIIFTVLRPKICKGASIHTAANNEKTAIFGVGKGEIMPNNDRPKQKREGGERKNRRDHGGQVPLIR